MEYYLLKKKINNHKIKRELGIKQDTTFIFSSIANLIPYKNQILIIKAAEKLKKINDKFMVILVGSGDKEYTEFLKKEIANRKLKNNFILIKQSRNVSDFYSISDVGISSSKQEGFSNTILEYLSFGKPVIATNVGGNPEIINNTNGILIENNNEEQLFNAMKKVITNKRDLKKFKDGAKKAIRNFSFDKMVNEYLNVYSKLC